jgi:hypothetical protein
MAFIRSSEPFQEPPRSRAKGPLMIGIAVFLLFFVPVLVISMVARHPLAGGPPAGGPGNGPLAGKDPLPGGPLPGAPGPGAPGPGGPGPGGFAQRVPPMPPPGAPWPPPPGAPKPPVCVLAYLVGADGSTVWTAMISQSGTLTVEDAAGSAHRDQLNVPVGIDPVALPAPLSQEHDLRAVLSSSSGDRSYLCVVGAET